MREETPIQPLNVFLLKTGLQKHEDALKEPNKLSRRQLKTDLAFKGALFVAPQRTAPPTWLDFLEGGTARSLGQLFNASASAVLFVDASKRTFAITFGYGRALLRPEVVKRFFGLRVVLNTVDPAALRSVDAKTVQELTVYTRRQTSRGSRLEAFELDTEQDLLGAMAGTPRDATLARTLSGSDALLIRSRLRFSDLADKCRVLLRAYRSEDYKRHGFGDFDHVRTVTDPSVTARLDKKLIDALTARQVGSLHLAPPAIIDWSKVHGFSFTRKAAPESDLDITSFFEQIRRPDELTLERIRRQQVFVHTGDAADPIPSWSIYSSIVCEFDLDNRRYVLTGGDWYEIEKSFVGRIVNRVARIRTAGLGLPAAKPGEYERDYNKRAAKKRGVYLTDRQCIRENGSPIELCDLYTTKRQFVHVKRWDSSSTLSHLFAQGLVSAETFISDEKFRSEARRLLSGKAAALSAHAPKERPDPGSYQVVYAIVIDKRPNWRQSLPFFSQLQLARSAERLRRLGFHVRVERIGIEE